MVRIIKFSNSLLVYAFVTLIFLVLFTSSVSAASCLWNTCTHVSGYVGNMSSDRTTYGWTIIEKWRDVNYWSKYSNANFLSTIRSKTLTSSVGYVSSSAFRIEDRLDMGVLMGTYIYVDRPITVYPYFIDYIGSQCTATLNSWGAAALFRADPTLSSSIKVDFDLAPIFVGFDQDVWFGGDSGCDWSYTNPRYVQINNVVCTTVQGFYLSPGVYYLIGGFLIAPQGGDDHTNFYNIVFDDSNVNAGQCAYGGLPPEFSPTTNYFNQLSSSGFVGVPARLTDTSQFNAVGLNADSNSDFCKMAGIWDWDDTGKCCGDDGSSCTVRSAYTPSFCDSFTVGSAGNYRCSAAAPPVCYTRKNSIGLNVGCYLNYNYCDSFITASSCTGNTYCAIFAGGDVGRTAGAQTCTKCTVSVNSLGYSSGGYYWVGPEACDGIDNNCDGQIDEGCDFSACACEGSCSTKSGLGDYCSGYFACGLADNYDLCLFGVDSGSCNLAATSCGDDSDCNSYFCDGSQCYCSDDSDCHSGEFCNTDNNFCEVCGGGLGIPCSYYDGDLIACAARFGCTPHPDTCAPITNSNICKLDSNCQWTPEEADETLCDGKDNDCDCFVDENLISTFFRDADGDTYGNASVFTSACTIPSGYVATFNDCDDNDAAVHPLAIEVCDGKDNDCDCEVDEGMLPHSQNCTIANGQGSQNVYCSGGGWVEDLCTVTDCDTYYHIFNNTCVPDTCADPNTQVCFVGHCNGTQSRTCFAGVFGSWGPCLLDSFEPGYRATADGFSCVAITCADSSTRNCNVSDHCYGIQSRTCNANVWTAWSNCILDTPNPGYAISADKLSCNYINYCGDGILNYPTEECDLGIFNTDNPGLPAVRGTTIIYCDTHCKNQTISSPICGDNVVTAPDEECDDGNTNDTDTCDNACLRNSLCLGYIPYYERIGFLATESPDYYVPASGPINYVCNGSDKKDVSVSADVVSGKNYTVEFAYTVIPGNSGYTCIDISSQDRFCQYMGYDAFDWMNMHPSSYTGNVPCSEWTGNSWTTNIHGTIGNISCKSMIPRGVFSNTTLPGRSSPVCMDAASIDMFCREKGYDSGKVAAFKASNVACTRGSYSGTWSGSTGPTGSIICTRYMGADAGATRVAFYINGVDYRYRCNMTSTGSPGPDGVCLDDFSINSICGHQANGLHNDSDCGEHVWMKRGHAQIQQGVDTINVYPIPLPSPIIHRECLNPTDCVYNDTSLGYICNNTGAVKDTGVLVPNDPTKITTINVVCSNNNTWCPERYFWDGVKCTFVGGAACLISDCPPITNFTVYDTLIFINQSFVLYHGLLNNAVNIFNPNIVLTATQYSTYRDAFLNRSGCVKINNSKINGICGVLITYPEFRYEYKDVIVK